jgi:hypothetical protein
MAGIVFSTCQLMRQFQLFRWHAALGLIPPEKGLATPSHAEKQRGVDLAAMQVQEVWRAVVGFEPSQLLRTPGRIVNGKDRSA